ncbi:MAG: hypothetical protein FWE95_08495, partial [Planctomycetaceae bacterium]|nr:hypothetical protein [Planctomycetaceae bacterium]
MTRTFLPTVTVAVLYAATALTTVAFAEVTKDTKLDWKFSEEVLQLFNPPMEATIEQMRIWADRLEQPFPNREDSEKYGG